MTEKGYYQKGMFIVENELFHENNKRLGYFEDEKEDEMKQNNHKYIKRVSSCFWQMCYCCNALR